MIDLSHYIPALYSFPISKHPPEGMPATAVGRIRVHTGTWQSWLFGLLGARAMVWNKGIHLTKHAPRAQGWPRDWFAIYAHEVFHVYQQRHYGWHIFVALYLYYGIRNLLRGERHPMQHPFEAAAYGYQGRLLQEWDKVHPL